MQPGSRRRGPVDNDCPRPPALLHPRPTFMRRRGRMLRRRYDWIMALAHTPQAVPALAAVAFAESSFFPVPPDAMIVPMVLAEPRRAWRIALVATSASVLGGLAGYAIGYYLQSFGQWVIGDSNF